MALQYSTTLRNNQLDAIETTAGTSAKIRVLTGSAPANCAAAETGTLLVQFEMASDWAAAASGGSKALSSLPLSDTADGGSGSTPGYFRIVDSAGTTCVVQGSAGIGSGDLSFNGTITAGQTCSITAFTISAANS